MGLVLQFKPLADQPAITQRRVRRLIEDRRGDANPYFALATLWTDFYYCWLHGLGWTE